MSRLRAAARDFRDEVGRRDLRLLAAALVLALVVRIVYWAFTNDHTLAGDEIEYHREGILWAEGHPFWSDAVYGIERPSAWKAPGYPAWVGVLYSVLGTEASRVMAVQTLLGPLNAFLVFLLARRLAGPLAGLVGAFAWAVYPPGFQYEQLLYSEGLAAVSTSVLLLALWRDGAAATTVRAAAAFGVVTGFALLLRPSAGFVFLAAAVFWLVLAGLRRATRLTVVAVGCAVLVVAPWTIRNAIELDGFIPISVQDAALAGTFNDTSANLPAPNTYAWLPVAERDRDLFDPENPMEEKDLRAELISRGRAYIADHPEALVESLWWNGRRLWDVRSPSLTQSDGVFEGRDRRVAKVAFFAYWLALPFALLGAWRLRTRSRAIAWSVAAFAVGLTLTYSFQAGTRYRAPAEPLIIALAAAGAASLVPGRRAGPTAAPGGAPAGGW